MSSRSTFGTRSRSKELTGAYEPEIPLVGSGPYVPTQYDRGRIVTMERNPEWRGEEPAYDELQFIKYGSNDAVERALTLGEIDIITEVQPATFERLGEEDGDRDPAGPDARSPSSRSTSARRRSARTRSSTPPSRTSTCARRSPTGSTASGSTRSRPRTPRSSPTGCCPRSTSRSLRFPSCRLSVRPRDGEPDPRRCRLGAGRRWGPRARTARTTLVRPLRALGVAFHGPDGEADRRAGPRRSGSSSTSRS